MGRALELFLHDSSIRLAKAAVMVEISAMTISTSKTLGVPTRTLLTPVLEPNANSLQYTLTTMTHTSNHSQVVQQPLLGHGYLLERTSTVSPRPTSM